MFTTLRSIAPAVLLLASLFGQCVTGVVLTHMVSQHAVSEHHGHHHAAEHPSDAEGEHAHSDHDSGHTHQLLPATDAASARISCVSIDAQPYLTFVGQRSLDRPAPSAQHHVAPPVMGTGPPESKRNAVLLI